MRHGTSRWLTISYYNVTVAKIFPFDSRLGVGANYQGGFGVFGQLTRANSRIRRHLMPFDE